MWYFIIVTLMFFMGIKSFTDYRRKYETKVYGFTKFDENDYAMWLLEWFMMSLIFPISLAFIFIIYILKKEEKSNK